jgi:hypothetical protein
MTFFSTVVAGTRLGSRDMDGDINTSSAKSLHEVIHVQLLTLEDVGKVGEGLGRNGLGIDSMLGRRPKRIVETVLIVILNLLTDVFISQLLLNHVGLRRSLVHERDMGNGFVEPLLDQVEWSTECMPIRILASSLNEALEHNQSQIVVILACFDQKFGVATEIGGELMQVLAWVLARAALPHALLESIVLLDGRRSDETNEGSPHQRKGIRLLDSFPNLGFEICLERAEQEPLSRLVVRPVVRVKLGERDFGLVHNDVQRKASMINNH